MGLHLDDVCKAMLDDVKFISADEALKRTKKASKNYEEAKRIANTLIDRMTTMAEEAEYDLFVDLDNEKFDEKQLEIVICWLENADYEVYRTIRKQPGDADLLNIVWGEKHK